MAGFSGEDLIEEALRYAGGEQNTADDVINARRSMYLLMEEWEAQWGPSFRIGRIWVPVLPAAPGLTLDATVDDVIDITVSNEPSPAADANFTPVGARMSPSEYAKVGQKLQDGQPSSYYLERGTPPVLFLYPTGAGLAATIWHHKLATAYDPDSNTIDAPSRWYRALMFGTARDVAAKRPWPTDSALMNSHDQRITRLETWAAQAFAAARPADRHRTSYRVRI